MMKTRKLTALLLGALLSVSLLSGCHGARDSVAFKTPEEFNESKTYELTFWAKNDTNIVQKEIYEKAISDFEKLYPNIKVNMRLYTDYSRLYNDVITNISTNTTPNICVTYPDHIATYMTGENTVVPLDDLFKDPNYGFNGSKLKFDAPSFDEVIPYFLNECKLNGYYYAVPYMRSTEALYINKDLVEKLGYEIPDIVTWDFVWEVSEKAMAQDKDGNYLINGQKVLIPFIYKSTDNMMIQYLKQMDAGYSNESGEINIFNDVTYDFLKTISAHTKNGAFSTFKISSYPGNFLNAGQCLFAVDSTAGATWMGSEAPNMDIKEDKVVKFETVVRPLPQADSDNIKMISQGPSICIFNKEDPDEVLASWLFMQFMLTNDVQIAYSETEGYVPVTSKAQTSPEYVDYLSKSGQDGDTHYHVKIEAASLLINNVDKTFVTPVFNGSASLRDAAGQMIEVATKTGKNGKDFDDALYAQLSDKMVSQYHLDQISTDGSQKKDLGPLPGTSVALLAGIIIAWIGIGCAFLLKNIKNKAAMR